MFTVMEHITNTIKSYHEIENSNFQEELDVMIKGAHILFGWNSTDISEISHTLGTPDIDLEPCG